MKKVFLSVPYGFHDRLSPLTDALKADGMEVWCADSMLLAASTNWNAEILSAIKRCDVFVAALFTAHPNVMFELGYALGGGKSVLLLNAGREPIPFDLHSLRTLTINQLDSRTVSEAVELIRKATVRSRRTIHDFGNAQEMLKCMCSDEAFLDEIEPRVFEECIVNVFKEIGFEVTPTAGESERGYDAELNDIVPNAKVVVEIKKLNRNSRISVSQIQTVVSSTVTAGAECAIVVTSGSFTASAMFCAQQSPIRVVLLTIDELLRLTQDDIRSHCT